MIDETDDATPEERREALRLVALAQESDTPDELHRHLQAALNVDPFCVPGMLLLAETIDSDDHRIGLLSLTFQFATNRLQERVGGEEDADDEVLDQDDEDLRNYVDTTLALAIELGLQGQFERALELAEVLDELADADEHVGPLRIGWHLGCAAPERAREVRRRLELGQLALDRWAAALEHLQLDELDRAAALVVGDAPADRRFRALLLDEVVVSAEELDGWPEHEADEWVALVTALEGPWRATEGALDWLARTAGQDPER